MSSLIKLLEGSVWFSTAWLLFGKLELLQQLEHLVMNTANLSTYASVGARLDFMTPDICASVMVPSPVRKECNVCKLVVLLIWAALVLCCLLLLNDSISSC